MRANESFIHNNESLAAHVFPLKVTSFQMLGGETVHEELPIIDLLEVFKEKFHISARYPHIKNMLNSTAQHTELINRNFGCNLSQSTLRSWKYTENPSLPNLVRFCNVDIDQVWGEISIKSRGSPWASLPRYVPFNGNLAYVIGALLADRGHKQEVSIVDTDLLILKEFVERLCSCFNVKKPEFQISRKQAKQFIARLSNKGHISNRWSEHAVRGEKDGFDG